MAEGGVQGALARTRIEVWGVVQGVGFRPFVYRLARRYGLAGFVRNHSRGVTAELEGDPGALDAFLEALEREAPPLSRIDRVESTPLPPRGEEGFHVVESVRETTREALVRPDAAVCDACLAELFDPEDRRYRYPFINCTDCGPRFTIIRDIPYDRPFTTMAAFTMCPQCQSEYEDPGDRRFHAQPNACPNCGPQAWYSRGDATVTGQDAFEAAARDLAAGAVVAVKGLGGYHLAVDPFNGEAVMRLRERKRRPHKPLAVMAADLATVEQLCQVPSGAPEILLSPSRPILLLPRREESPLAPEVYRPHATVGVMVAYTPLHYLLLDALKRRGHAPVLVMTSGNVSGQPILADNAEAHARLGGVADAFLDHNRPIHIRCDDSVAQLAADGGLQLLRRARGFVPDVLPLAPAAPVPLLAVGGQEKSAFALGQGERAFLSQYLGDLEMVETLEALKAGVEHFCRVFAIRPQVVVHDLHPGYLSTRYAQETGVPALAVQHHHAHIASVLAEAGHRGPVVGVAADGTGYGDDGTLWGGEILLATLRGYQRVGHLAPLSLPGGERAIREPWRLAVAALYRLWGEDLGGRPLPLPPGVERRTALAVARLPAGPYAPLTTSLGRYFDLVAALLGIGQVVSFEGQAAMELEAVCAAGPAQPYPYHLRKEADGLVMDLWPALEILAVTQEPVPVVAARFHATVAAMLEEAVREVVDQTGIREVALSGGVFQNRRLTRLLRERLTAAGLDVLLNHAVPPNDGGLAYGQLAVAAARLTEGEEIRT
ncbi:Carbamoyltransferase HypF2 [Candidatus Hydrogenisulfobacillus filiaventi]|uniref:Carbamoyltransferase n=1 Tax=Candidatus Hydrogenisulfobacillus filiaventi TaxID=2707344 RepID=A0A6F8ZFV8_9FIRM|nr:Carbamoyltransferase HypF2 [Candidatus Hydrogenisulfobacillus filiaventi]